MNDITENQYAHWLFNLNGFGNTTIDKLLSTGLSCGEIFESNGSEFKGILTAKQIKTFDETKNIWDFEKELRKLEEKRIIFLPRIDDRFPEKLKNIPNAPFALYLKGELPDPAKPAVAIIGARMCSEYGRFMARNFGRGLALAGVQVISGMARGIDGVIQKAALAAGGKSFGIVANGVDICYPEENMDIYEELCCNGGVISEFPPGTMPKASFFPMRNRIISGLADIVLVIEARGKSGTQITVDTALEQGREILAVPGRATDRLSDGCNQMISQGAGVALDVQDVLDRIHMIRSENEEATTAKAYYMRSQREAAQASGGLMHVTNADGLEYTPDNMQDAENQEGFEEPRDLTLNEHILEILGVIPYSISYILEELEKKGVDVSVPTLLQTLTDMVYEGTAIQKGTYYVASQG